MNKKLDFDLNFLNKKTETRKIEMLKKDDDSSFDKDNRAVLKVAGIFAVIVSLLVMIGAFAI